MMNTNELNLYRNLELIEAKSALELRDRLREVRGILSIVQIYSDGKKHYALVLSNRKI